MMPKPSRRKQSRKYYRKKSSRKYTRKQTKKSSRKYTRKQTRKSTRRSTRKSIRKSRRKYLGGSSDDLTPKPSAAAAGGGGQGEPEPAAAAGEEAARAQRSQALVEAGWSWDFDDEIPNPYNRAAENQAKMRAWREARNHYYDPKIKWGFLEKKGDHWMAAMKSRMFYLLDDRLEYYETPLIKKGEFMLIDIISVEAGGDDGCLITIRKLDGNRELRADERSNAEGWVTTIMEAVTAAKAEKGVTDAKAEKVDDEEGDEEEARLHLPRVDVKGGTYGEPRHPAGRLARSGSGGRTTWPLASDDPG